MTGNKIAILIFASSIDNKIVSKPFPSYNLIEVLNQQTISIAKKTNFPFFHINQNEQIGSNFGERFTNALNTIYNKGFNTVIAIGNDTPHLTSKHLLKTAEKLKTHPVVLGPSKDGGFYLIGLKKALFNPVFFLKLPWQTPTLKRSISKLLATNNTKIYYLEQLVDLDNISDIKYILNSFKSISAIIKSILLLPILISKEIIAFIVSKFLDFILNKPHNKGSPHLQKSLTRYSIN